MILVNSRFLTQRISGVQRNAISLSMAIKKLDDNISFVSPRNIIHRKIAEQLEVRPCGYSKSHIWEQVELPLYLGKMRRPLLVNLANTAPLTYRHQVITICDLSFLRHPEWFSKKFSYYYGFLLPRIAKSALKVITISEFSKSEILSLLGIPEDRVHVVHCGVPEIFINSAAVARTDNKYGNYILAVSSLDPRKNFKGLIEAFRRLNLPDIRLVIAGAENRVFSKSTGKESCGDIVFTGHVGDDELIALYRNAMLFVYPSFYEGFGMPPLEAMACGCPVVASNSASIPEICGNAAHYVDPFDCDDIACGIKEVLNNTALSCSLRERGLERVRLFSYEESGRSLMSIIKQL